MPHAHVSAAGAALPAAHFIQVTPSMRRAIEALVADLILFLDEIDGDVDLEGEHSGHGTIDPDLELSWEDEGADTGDDEPSLGWTDTGHLGGLNDAEQDILDQRCEPNAMWDQDTDGSPRRSGIRSARDRRAA